MFESFQRHKQFLLLEWNLKKGKCLRWAYTEGYLNQKKKSTVSDCEDLLRFQFTNFDTALG